MKIISTIIVLICLISLERSRFLKTKTKTAKTPLFLQYTATVFGGGSIKKSVRVYNRTKDSQGNDIGNRIYRAVNQMALTLTGEMKILTTPKGPRKCHRLKEENRKNLIDNKTKDSRSQVEIWIPTEHLQNFNYPNVKTTRNGQIINNTNTTGASCWYYALIGNLDSNADITLKKYDDIIDTISNKIRTTTDEFDGMVDN